MDTLIYLSYGRGPHLDQLIYSVLSTQQVLGSERSNYRIVVYTDDPDATAGLPVQIEVFDDERLVEWAGPLNFNHRRKIFAIKDALLKFGGRLLYCDADTYFLKHPRKLFTCIRPGHPLMHIREGHLNYVHGTDIACFLQNHDLKHLDGTRWDITPDTPMFNAGVIGFHESDSALLDEVVHLTDQIYPQVGIHTVEQFAFSACLRHYTRLRQSYRIVHHYWPGPGREQFNADLRRVLHDPSITSHEERLLRLSAVRPRQSIRYNRHLISTGKRMCLALREVAKRTGLLHLIRGARPRQAN